MHNQKKDNTNLKTINNQNSQNIKLHGTLTIKELKKHSSRLVGGQRRVAGWVERTGGKAGAG